MSEENNNDNTNIDDQNKNQENVSEILNKYKDTDDFKNLISEAIKKEHDGLIKNRDNLLSENAKLKEYKNKASEDEVVKLMTSGKPEDRQKAIDLLSADAVAKHLALIEEKDNAIKAYQEKEEKFNQKLTQETIANQFKKSPLFANIKDEAVDDYILPAIYANFKVNEGKVEYTGKEINKQGKPLSLDEYLVHYLKVEKDRSFFLKDIKGSNTLFKSTQESTTDNSKTKKTYEERMRDKGFIKE